MKPHVKKFGYKKKHSRSHAIYTVKRCIEYFTEHGSHVYATFLDCTKGFDRVSHSGLFLKLLQRKVHPCWIRVLFYWYSNLSSVCKWRDSLSDVFSVISLGYVFGHVFLESAKLGWKPVLGKWFFPGVGQIRLEIHISLRSYAIDVGHIHDLPISWNCIFNIWIMNVL